MVVGVMVVVAIWVVVGVEDTWAVDGAVTWVVAGVSTAWPWPAAAWVSGAEVTGVMPPSTMEDSYIATTDSSLPVGRSSPRTVTATTVGGGYRRHGDLAASGFAETITERPRPLRRAFFLTQRTLADD